MCKEHTIPKYPSIINHKKPFYVNVNGEKEEISISLQRTKYKSIKESSNRSFKLSCFLVNMQKMDIKWRTLTGKVVFWYFFSQVKRVKNPQFNYSCQNLRLEHVMFP